MKFLLFITCFVSLSAWAMNGNSSHLLECTGKNYQITVFRPVSYQTTLINVVKLNTQDLTTLGSKDIVDRLPTQITYRRDDKFTSVALIRSTAGGPLVDARLQIYNVLKRAWENIALICN